MTLTLVIHDSWRAHPGPLSRLLAHLHALEAPAPWTPPVTREPGQDEDESADLARLLEGIDTPEPAPAAPAPARPAPAPQPATPLAREWDGVPKTGRGLYKWACERKALPAVNRVGASFNYPKRVSDWSDDQVAAAYAILTSEPAQNGRAH
jgi:hypothetical protein